MVMAKRNERMKTRLDFSFTPYIPRKAGLGLHPLGVTELQGLQTYLGCLAASMQVTIFLQ